MSSKLLSTLSKSLFCSSLCLWFLMFAAGCYQVHDQLSPRIDYQLQEQHLAKLSSPFPPLTPEEKATDWGKELMIARAFAEELDLYRAVSTFKRAAILLSPLETLRKLEIQYDILLCYFLARRYDEAVEAFQKSDLAYVDQSFPPYHDLLSMIYECSREMKDGEKEQCMNELIAKTYPDTAEKLNLSSALRKGDLPKIQSFADGFQQDSYLDGLLQNYYTHKKSIGKAQLFNALLPGTGYLYLGLNRSALTAFLLNGLFIAAAVQFFRHGHMAAGLITSSFEAGWYFGGIYGAGEEAKYYNEKLYEKSASQVLNEHRLFPALMMRYAF